MKRSLPVLSVKSHLVEHRRNMLLKGQLHLEQLAVTAAGAPFDPLPKRKAARPQVR